jgi:hypothetical protein
VHAVPHLPQLFVSVLVLTQAVVHQLSPVVQQWLVVHVCAVVHAVPHPPQFALSDVVSLQADAQHVWVPQAVVQLPQWLSSFVKS